MSDYYTNHTAADKAIDALGDIADAIDSHNGGKEARDLRLHIRTVEEAIADAIADKEQSDHEARQMDEEMSILRLEHDNMVDDVEIMKANVRTLESRNQYLLDSIAADHAAHKQEIAKLKRQASKTAKEYSEAMSSQLLT